MLAGDGTAMRVAVVTESFLPQVNGVTNSVLRVCEHLQLRGHEAVVVAPGAGPGLRPERLRGTPERCFGAEVVRVPSVPVPSYGLPVAYPVPGLTDLLRDFGPDVVHLASPTVLGAQALTSAHKLHVPAVAVYQTDLAAFAALHGLAPARRAIWSWLRTVHNQAAVTLAPSRQAVADLTAHGVQAVRLWPRGVDTVRFDPAHRDPQLHGRWAGHVAGTGRAGGGGGGAASAGGASGRRTVVGYVGRLAAEKQVELLAGLGRRDDVQLVVVGDGPRRADLEHDLPGAVFTGQLQGAALARAFASLDLFVHTGAHETFCQSVQEALASGVPVVAPDAGGPLDLVQAGATGEFFAAGDADDLTRVAGALVDDPDRRAAMGARARAWVAGRDWTHVGDTLLGHYREVCGTVSTGLSA